MAHFDLFDHLLSQIEIMVTSHTMLGIVEGSVPQIQIDRNGCAAYVSVYLFTGRKSDHKRYRMDVYGHGETPRLACDDLSKKLESAAHVLQEEHDRNVTRRNMERKGHAS